MTETTQTDRGEVPVYRAGALAYIDSFSGLIPVSVLAVDETGYGWRVAPASGKVRIRVNATRGGYQRGEVFTDSAHNVVPRPQVWYTQLHGQPCHARINSDYTWAAS